MNHATAFITSLSKLHTSDSYLLSASMFDRRYNYKRPYCIYINQSALIRAHHILLLFCHKSRFHSLQFIVTNFQLQCHSSKSLLTDALSLPPPHISYFLDFLRRIIILLSLLFVLSGVFLITFSQFNCQFFIRLSVTKLYTKHHNSTSPFASLSILRIACTELDYR